MWEKKLLLLDAIKNDTRVQILNCDKYSDENGDAPATQKYSVEKSLFGQTPLISGSEITCELGKDVSEKQLARVMAIENGVINGIDYTLFHSDASGSVGQNNAEWQVVCEKDAMTDAQIVQRCAAPKTTIYIFIRMTWVIWFPWKNRL